MAVESSIIVRTFNEEKHIERLLMEINRQNLESWEVIIVDSGSTDHTVEIAKKYTSSILNIPSEEFSFGRSLNLGCRHAQGKYLVFVSAHTYPTTNNWLANMIRPFEDPAIAMVYGRQEGVETTRIAEERDYEHYMYGPVSEILVDRPFGNNANAAIRRDLWLQQPFDEALTGLEDIDWAKKAQRKGYRIYYAADASIYHIHQEGPRQVYQRYKREGIAYKIIFRSARFGLGSLVKSVCVTSAKDFVYGVRKKKSLRKLFEIVPMRIAEFLGTYQGINYQSKLTREMLQQLYYPTVNASVVIRAPGEHRLENREIPVVGDDEVLIQVAYVAICSTDLEVTNGQLDYYQKGYAQFPIVPGHEYSGVIIDVGKRANGFRKGDKVVGECAVGCGECEYCQQQEYFRCTSRKEVGVVNMDGAYSQLLRLPGKYVHKIPTEMPLLHAALVEPVAVCLKGLRKLNLVQGRTACVVGAGPIGNLCAQILKHKGMKVAVIDRNSARLRIVGRYGIDTWSDFQRIDSFDYVVEASGNSVALKPIIEGSKPSAKILILGLPHVQPVETSFSSVVCYDKEIYGSIASSPMDWEEAIGLIGAGAIDLEEFTQSVFSLDKYDEAWKLHQEGKHLKVLLNVTSELAAV